MRVVCAWCRAVLKPGAGDAAPDVSHGICPTCNQFFFEGGDPAQGTLLSEFLQDLPVPVMVTEATGAVVAANTEAASIAGIGSDQIAGARSGDVIGCVNARRLHGCGATDSCGGCVIRRTIEETHASGEAREAVTAVQKVITPEGPRRLRYNVATRMWREVVLLRIDEVVEARESDSTR